MSGAEKDVRAERFRDPGGRLWRYRDRVLVRCPRCAGCATVLRPWDEGRGKVVGDPRLVCAGCGYTRRPKVVHCHHSGKTASDSSSAAGYFGFPLWLQAPCRGRTLWAYNAEHLAVLKGYVGAGLREDARPRTAYTMVEILPRWMKLAKHRGEVLRVLDRLQRALPESSDFSR